jgi:hypothetical protein
MVPTASGREFGFIDEAQRGPETAVRVYWGSNAMSLDNRRSDEEKKKEAKRDIVK